MRPVALGRKNRLHIGSPQAGLKVRQFSRSLKVAVA